MIRKILFIFILSTLSCTYAEKAEYIFSKGFSGWSAIVFNCSNGVKAVKNKNGLQFIIPKSGVLLLSFNRSKGALNDTYFIVDEGGLKKEIVEVSRNLPPSDSLLYIRGKLLVNKYMDEKNLDEKYSIVYLNLSSQYSTSISEEEFKAFENEVSTYLVACGN